MLSFQISTQFSDPDIQKLLAQLEIYTTNPRVAQFLSCYLEANGGIDALHRRFATPSQYDPQPRPVKKSPRSVQLRNNFDKPLRPMSLGPNKIEKDDRGKIRRPLTTVQSTSTPTSTAEAPKSPQTPLGNDVRDLAKTVASNARLELMAAIRQHTGRSVLKPIPDRLEPVKSKRENLLKSIRQGVVLKHVEKQTRPLSPISEQEEMTLEDVLKEAFDKMKQSIER